MEKQIYDKKTGQGCDKIYRDTFSSNAKQNEQMSQEQKMV